MLSPMGAHRRRPLLPPLERERDASEEERGGRVDKDAPSPPTQRFIPVQKKEKKSPFLGSARLIGCRFF